MKKWGAILLLLLALIIGGGVFYAYQLLRAPNVLESKVVEIPTGSDFQDVLSILQDSKVLSDETGLERIAEMKHYKDRVKPGRYRLEAGFSVEEVIDKLRSGDQEAVKLTFNNIKTIGELAGALSQKVEADSLSLAKEFTKTEKYAAAGFSDATRFSAFVPNTYEVWWNVKAEDLFDRLINERKRFWQGERRKKAAKIGLTTQEVATLASIVQEETKSIKDAPKIAGVYLNRIRIGMPLQADPTLLFAIGDPTIKRVLDKDKEVESPYNTYKYAGLPPGPLNIPDPQYLDAVLNAPSHKLLYFCASSELDGSTVFARTYGEHLRNARAYQRALNQQGTFR